MKLLISRFRTVRGAIVGRLYLVSTDGCSHIIDREFICFTVEREGGCLPQGEYRLEIAKSPVFHRKMPFLRAPNRQGLIQPGNGPFNLPWGSILVGEARQPGFVVHSQPVFLQLFERLKKAISRGGEVGVRVEENYST